jgi:subtilase family serine protease
LRTGLVSPTSTIGAGQVIAIVDAYHDPNALSDLNTFDAEYGYPALATCSASAGPPFTASTGACFYQADPYGTFSPPANAQSWIVEESLDIEWARAEAPGATIVLVEAKSSDNTDLMNAVSWANGNGATEVSMSWGEGEFSGETSYDSYFDADSTSTGAPIIYTASSGDGGSGVSYPAASPNVIAVGGTTLNGCSGTSCPDFSSETAWSDSGGGVSAYEKVPAYQSGYSGAVYSESSGGISALTGTKRGIPDVSFDADPNTGVSVYDSTAYDGESGWWTVGGTSVGSPNWAGIFAAGAGNATALQGAQAIYGGGYASYLRDITSGSNGACGTDCTAGTGYDLVTGLGSPINYPPASPPTVTSVSPSSGPSTGGTAVTVTGTGFVAGSTTVEFGSSPATHVSVSSPEQLSATSPAAATGAVNVTVTTPFGTSATGSSDEFFYTSTAPSTSPQGNWVGTYGGSGYALADWNGSTDTTSFSDATLSLVEGSRYEWSSSTTGVRALESPSETTREATCWYSYSQLELQLSFSSSYSGNLELYALDWDSLSRSETIDVNDGSSPETADLSTPFVDGAWMVFPISVAPGGTVTITVQVTGGANAVLSGIFLGGA